jgi:hypothetical protein
MKDYKDIPFKNAAIDRLTSMTTKPLMKIKSAIKQARNTGLEYEPKVRKRHMKP